MLGLDLGTLALVALFAFLVAGALSPIETLGWWAGWYGDEVDAEQAARDAATAPAEGAAMRGHDPLRYVIFLSGINSVSDDHHTPRERVALDALRRALPEARVVAVFPYSVTNRALTASRAFSAFWRAVLRLKLGRRRAGQLAGVLINVRNGWQVAVSADRRYGPYYNRGTAELIVRTLVRHGYRLGSGMPVVLIGYSGGGQVAVGAAPFVKHQTHGPVTVLSLGGVVAADPGLLETDHVLHVFGRRDRVHRLGDVFFPGRWRILPHSPWNQARVQGRLRIVEIGPGTHTGAGGYLDGATRVADGRTLLDVTVDVLASAARDPTGPLPVAAEAAAEAAA